MASTQIIIAGHTDAVGSIEYNQVLSERRAEAARRYLVVEDGVDSKRLTAKGEASRAATADRSQQPAQPAGSFPQSELYDELGIANR